MFIVAEWAIARLQIEGARQEKARVHHGKSADLETKTATQQSGGLSISGLRATSKHLPVQDRSPTAVDGVDPGATHTNDSPKVSIHGSYNCLSGKHSGKLIVTSTGVRFESAVGSKDQWEMRYDSMHRVEKVRHSRFPIFLHHPTDIPPTNCKTLFFNRSTALSKSVLVKTSFLSMGVVSLLLQVM